MWWTCDKHSFRAANNKSLGQEAPHSKDELDLATGLSWRVAEGLVGCTCDFAPKGSRDACDDIRFVGPTGSLKMKGMDPADPIPVNIGELSFDFPEHRSQALIQVATEDLRDVNRPVFYHTGTTVSEANKF